MRSPHLALRDAPAIVCHVERQVARLDTQSHPNTGRVGMLGDVVQCLLQHPENRGRHGIGHGIAVAIDVEVQRESRAPREIV